MTALTFRSPVVLVLALTALTVPARAQMTVTGSVLDGEGAPVAFANVQLLVHADSALARATIADEAGNYLLDAIEAGSYLLYVSLIGYQDHLSDVIALTGNGERRQKTIDLVQATIEMQGMSVVARRSLYEQKGDRLVINVGTSVTLSGGTALDVLERSPGVVVNEQAGSISMLGKDGVRVMINGKLSHIPADGLVQFLAGMSADNVESIELITSPPAEFDAEGNAGFINIVLKRRPEDGFNGSLSASAGYGKGETGSAAFNFDYRRNRLTLFGSYGFLWNGQQQQFSNFRRIAAAEGLLETPTLSRRDPVQRNHNARLGIDFDVSERTTLGIVVAGYDNRWSMNAFNALVTNLDGSPIRRIDSDNEEVNHWRHLMGNLNLRHRMKKGGTINIDVDHLRYHNNNPTDYRNRTTDVESEQTTSALLHSDKVTPLRILVAKVDYTSNVMEPWTLGAGVKGAFSRFTNGPTFVSSVQNAWVDLAGMGTKSYLHEDVVAAYGSATYEPGEASSLKIGLRYELTDSNLRSDKEDDLVDRRFGSLFPSIVYSHKLGDEFKAAASYARRITRPSFSDMAPFLYFVDPQTFFTGSTSLQPAVMSALKMDVTYGSVIASLQYSWEDSSIARFQNRIIPGENVQILFPANMSLTRTATALLAAPVYVTGWWSTQNTLMTIWQRVEGPRIGAPVDLSHTSVMLSTTQNISLPGDLGFEATAFYRHAGLFGTLRFGSIWGVNLGLQRALPGGRGKLTLSVDDLFNSRKWMLTTGAPTDPIYIKSLFESHHRTFRLTYSMRFGDGESATERSAASASESARVQ